MARAAKKTRSRTEAERARVYAARTAWHDGQIRRRVRDNTLAGVVGGVLVVLAIGSQVVHAQVTAPADVPTPPALENPFAPLLPSPEL